MRGSIVRGRLGCFYAQLGLRILSRTSAASLGRQDKFKQASTVDKVEAIAMPCHVELKV